MSELIERLTAETYESDQHGIWAKPRNPDGKEAKAALEAATAREAELVAQVEALTAENERLRGLLEMAADAYWGMIQTELAASEVGVDLARQITTEGYGLNLKLAMKAARATLEAKP